MSKKAHETALPKLRFPEFRDKGEWVNKKLGELTSPISERNKKDKKLPVYSISNVNGFVPQSAQFEGVDSHERGYDVTLYKIVGKNTFAYNPARINIGSIGYSGELNEVLISSLYVCFKTNDDLNDLFLWHFVKSAAFNQAVNDTVEGGIRSYLFYENLATIKINIPSLLEQQKIAAALSSLDALLTAQTAKLTALQAHKRGLMQDLFPAEGETVPKRRFPEFLDAGEWVEKKLGEIVRFGSGGTPSKEKVEFWNGDIPWISASSMHETTLDKSDLNITVAAKKAGAAIVGKGMLLLLVRGSILYKRIPIGITTREVAFNQDVKSLQISKELTSLYLLHYLISAEKTLLGKVTATGIGAGKLDTDDLKQFPICIPSLTEQRKLIDCLSSLDNLITVQSQKIESLKLHKKGLMQALFPAASEPNA